jgi:hypothetical protein
MLLLARLARAPIIELFSVLICHLLKRQTIDGLVFRQLGERACANALLDSLFEERKITPGRLPTGFE